MKSLRSSARDHALVDQRLEIDHPLPEFAAEEEDRHRLHLAGLDQGEQLERLVERAEAAGKDRHRPRAQQEVHLPQREIVELEARGGRHIGVGHLLVRQHDVEADRCPALVDGAAIGRLHDRRAAARADDEMALAVLVGLDPAGEPGELARLVIIFGLGLEPLRDRALAVGRGGRDQRVGLRRLGDAGRAVEDEGRGDAGFVEQQLRLQQLELEADRAQILAQQEIHVLEGEPIGGVADGLRALRVAWAAVSASSRAGWKTRLGGMGSVIRGP